VSRAGNTARLTVCDSITDLDAVVARGPDFVLLVAKYIFIQSAENIWFSDCFLQNEITLMKLVFTDQVLSDKILIVIRRLQIQTITKE
jgi:hypothetical protein